MSDSPESSLSSHASLKFDDELLQEKVYTCLFTKVGLEESAAARDDRHLRRDERQEEAQQADHSVRYPCRESGKHARWFLYLLSTSLFVAASTPLAALALAVSPPTQAFYGSAIVTLQSVLSYIIALARGTSFRKVLFFRMSRTHVPSTLLSFKVSPAEVMNGYRS